MSSRLAAVGAVLLASALATAQSDWTLCGGAGAVHVVGATTNRLAGPRASKSLPAGDVAVHFGVDAAGKPSSLRFVVPDGASVQLAIEPAAQADWRDIAADAEAWEEHRASSMLRVLRGSDGGPYRVEGECVVGDDTKLLGLLARWRGRDQHYRFVLDRSAGEVRFERRLGSELVLARAKFAPPAAGVTVRLAFQVQGFRLLGCIDDAPVLACFDGALTAGAFGTCHSGTAPNWRVRVGAAAASRGSAAAIQDGAHVVLHAATDVVPGHWHVLRLALDRPHALLPTANGVEPWLLQRPAAPEILIADWRGRLGRDGIGELGPDGRLRCELELPALPALRHQVALLSALMVGPHGEEVVGRTPGLAVRF
ncbi:MAG: hypothetical protein MUC36_11585 [Planctomycetes bacterium]|nr:hypothetical protein [Planctomycetota bacterium]